MNQKNYLYFCRPILSRVKKQMDYIIPFKGLSVGSHLFRFEIGKTFFESFDYFEDETGDLTVNLELVKESALMNLFFKIEGNISLKCDRCLTMYNQHVAGDFILIVKFGDTFVEESDEVIVLPVTESSLDVSQFIFEYINLLLPIKTAHPNEGDCDPKMIEKLHNFSKQEIDPRWDGLKNIKLD